MTTMQQPPTGYPPTEPTPPPRARRRQMHWLGWVGIGLAVLLVAGGVAAGISGSGHSGKTATTQAGAPAGIPLAPSQAVPDQASPSLTLPDPNAPRAVDVGETFYVTATDVDNVISRADVVVNSVKDLGSVIPAADEYSQPDTATHGRFVIFTITYLGQAGTFDYNQWDWSIVMPDGQRFDPDAMTFNNLSSYGQPLNSGTLHTGQRAKGILVADVPRTHGSLTYNGGTFGYGQEVDIPF